MKIEVYSHNTDTQKVYEGEPLEILKKLYFDYPWLRPSVYSTRPESLEDTLEYLDSTQMFEASTLNDPEEQLEKALNPKDFTTIYEEHHKQGTNIVDHKEETHPGSVDPSVHAYKTEVINPPTVFNSNHRNIPNSESPDRTGTVSKVVVKGSGENRFLVKPYHEKIFGFMPKYDRPKVQGWAEMTHQAIYHAAGIGQNHQKVFVHDHKMGGAVPSPGLVVHMEDPEKYDIAHDFDKRPEGSAEQKANYHNSMGKMHILDYLTNNEDRHTFNYMVNKETHHVMAIDNGRAFHYPEDIKTDLPYYTMTKYGNDPSRINNISHHLKWVSENEGKIKAAFDKRLPLIKDPNVRLKIEHFFNSRLAHVANLGRQPTITEEDLKKPVSYNYKLDEYSRIPKE